MSSIRAIFASSIQSARVRPHSCQIYRSDRGGLCCAGFVAIILLVGCGPSREETPVVNAPVPLSYVGAEACGACHVDQFEDWRGSHHDLAMQHATPDTVLGDFSNSDYLKFGVTSTFTRRGDTFYVRTDNADGELEEYAIKYVFGVTPLQQYLIEFPGGRLQTLPIAWDSRSAADGGQSWFHVYADEAIVHSDLLHWTGREQNWNYMCAECHSTDLQKNYSVDSDSYETTWSEINVACEACHGPGSRHIEQINSGTASGLHGLQVDLDDTGRAVWEMNIRSGIAERSELRMRVPAQPEACGRCHSRRAVITPEYEFGLSLLDTHQVALLDEFLYFPDGQIREEVYVYGSFVQSRMYQAGVSCGDCHDPHTARLRTGDNPSDICSTCHLPEKFAGTEHHRHAADDVACVDCHMPSRIYMGNDGRRDHSFRIPRPDLTISTGSPNACNQCHENKSADWALAAVHEWFGDSEKAHYATALHAGQRGMPGANDELVAAISNIQYPGIARASALTLLQAPYSGKVAQIIQESLLSPDPFVRVGALRALASVAPETRVLWAGPLLADPVRSVRIEAARAVSPARSFLPEQFSGIFGQAEHEMIESLNAIAERPEAHSNLGSIHVESGNAGQAEAEMRTALRLEPRAVGPRANLADLYRVMGREQDAENVLREGLQLDADSAALHHSLGLLMVRGDRPENALAELARAAVLDPANARFTYTYAIALNSLGQADKGIVILQNGAARFPADFDIHWALASILRDQGRIEDARMIAAGMLALYPEAESVQALVRSL